MVNLSISSHFESFATNRPPFFTGTDYPYWKTKITSFLQSTDLDVWDVIEDGPTFPSKLVDGVMVPNPKQEWDECDRNFFQLIMLRSFILCNVLWIEMNIIEFINANRLKKFRNYL